MKIIENLALQSAGYIPDIPRDELKSVFGLSWVNWVKTDIFIDEHGDKINRKNALELLREEEGKNVKNCN